MIKIGLLLYPQCLPAGLLTGLDFFNAANQLAQNKLYDVQTVGLQRGLVSCAHKLEMKSEQTVDKFDPDIVVVPGFWSRSPEDIENVLFQNAELRRYLSSLTRKTAIWSYCTGVLFHADTGRLKNQKATATWWLLPYLEMKFPNIEWEINQTVVKGRNDLTASGANGFYALYESGMELQNETQVLQEVQKYLMIPTSLKMADPFYDLELILSSTLELLKIKRIVEGLPAFSLSTQVVAAKLSVSTKTLARRLSKQSQWTPAKLLWRIKYKQAAELFLLTNLTVSEICQKLGFEDESNFRRGFKQSSGMTPGEYQQKFKVTHTKLQIG